MASLDDSSSQISNVHDASREHLGSLYTPSKASATSLPMETLEKIFYDTGTPPYNVRYPWEFRYELPTILDVSHVCRYWRAVALDSGRLWTDIDLARPMLGMNFLQRSKGCNGLHVHWRYGHRDVDHGSWLYPHSSRIELLVLDLDTEVVNHFLSQIGPTLPRLTHLDIQSWGSYVNIGKLIMPSLRVLLLRAMVLEDNEVQNMLRNSTGLEEIYLDEVDYSGSLPVTQDIVELPLLTDITFYFASPFLLERIAIPLTSSLFVTRGHQIIEPSDDGEPLAWQARLRRPNHTHLIIQQTSIISQDSLHDSQSSIELEIYYDYIDALCDALNGAQLFDWSRIVSLDLALKCMVLDSGLEVSDVVAPCWEKLFPQLPMLQDLSILDFPLEDIMKALSPPISSTSIEDDFARFPCPHLETLRLRDHSDLCSTCPEDERSLRSLLRFLEDRRRMHRSIKKLVLKNCYKLTRGCIKLFETFVENVDADTSSIIEEVVSANEPVS